MYAEQQAHYSTARCYCIVSSATCEKAGTATYLCDTKLPTDGDMQEWRESSIFCGTGADQKCQDGESYGELSQVAKPL